MTTDLKALCAELADALEAWLEDEFIRASHSDKLLISRARAVLAQPEPEGPTEDEMDDLFWRHSCEIGDIGVGLAFEDAPALIREALARWGRPAVKPVPVSERLPGPEDCDAEGRCWWWDDDDDKWCLHEHSPRILCWTHWRPHCALPVPTTSTETNGQT